MSAHHTHEPMSWKAALLFMVLLVLCVWLSVGCGGCGPASCERNPTDTGGGCSDGGVK